MKIKTKNTVKVGGKHHPPNKELDVSEEVAKELSDAGAAEIIWETVGDAKPKDLAEPPEGDMPEENTPPDNENPGMDDDTKGLTPSEDGVNPVIVQAVRAIMEAGETDPELLTKDKRPKVSAVSRLLLEVSDTHIDVTADDIQAAMEVIEAETEEGE